jgi:hypothetical protein
MLRNYPFTLHSLYQQAPIMVQLLSKRAVLRDTRRIHTVRVSIQTHGSKDRDHYRSWNHWSIYLLLEDGTGAVRANMRTEDCHHDNGVLEWTDCHYTLHNSTLAKCDMPCQSNFRVCDIAGLIYDYRRHRYDFNHGKGCRWWTYVVATDLARHWVVGTEKLDRLWRAMHLLYHTHYEPEPSRLIQGTFY